MASVIKAGNATDGVQVTSDNTGILELKTGTGAGTTAMTVGTDQAVTFAQSANLPNTFGFKNRIINGAMVIDQRNAGASVTSNASINPYTLDRWRSVVYAGGGSGQFSVQQNAGSVTPPAGFTNYLGVTSLAATTVVSGAYYAIRQPIEGFNVADFSLGSASAVSMTLSFWVRSSLTGTFGGSIQNNSNNRSYPFTYTISAANTWEQKSVVIAGDTTGTWTTNNTTGIDLYFSLGAGSTWTGTAGAWAGADYKSPTGATQVVATNGATFYITGVQLEKGSTATSFDYRPYSTELQLAQRYYFKYVASSGSSGFFVGYASQTTVAEGIVSFPVSMRTPPTSLETTGTASNYRVRFLNSAATCSSVPTFFIADIDSSHVRFTVSSGLTAGDGIIGASNAAANVAYLAWSAEL